MGTLVVWGVEGEEEGGVGPLQMTSIHTYLLSLAARRRLWRFLLSQLHSPSDA